MDKVGTLQMLKSYNQRGFSLIPLKSRAKIPLVKWKEYRLSNEDLLRFTSKDTNWAIRCDDGFHALDFDNPERYERFIQEKGDYFSGVPVVRTGRGYHVWFKPKRPVNSFTQDGIEVKGLGSLIAIPPSIHPTGAEYQFIKPPNGKLPEIDLDNLFEVPADSGSKQAGEEERVWSEVKKAGYDLVAGDVTGSPTPEDIALYLNKALCHENAPLNTRRKITHSRGLLKKTVEKVQEQVVSNESIQHSETKEVEENMENTSLNRDSREWDTEVLMKPIGEVAKELEAEGWDIIWSSEVEAIAVKKKESSKSPLGRGLSNILELMASLGIEMHKAGSEYMGLCPFHDDHSPSLSVNAEKGVWHCFGCGKSGNYHSFLEEWRALQKG